MGDATTTCPRCNAPLEQLSMKGVTVDRCTTCMGHWFDAGELTLEIEVLRPITDEEIARGSATSLPCLRCEGKHLVEILFPGTTVAIVACPGCHGTWLDRGRLADIHAALRAVVGEAGTSPNGARTQEILSEIQKAEAGTLCPRCQKPLETFVRKGLLLDRCNTCHGLWYDAGELTADLGVSRKIGLKEAKPTTLPCPRCPRALLVSVSYPRTDVPIEVCPDCRGASLDEERLLRIREKIGIAT